MPFGNSLVNRSVGAASPPKTADERLHGQFLSGARAPAGRAGDRTG